MSLLALADNVLERNAQRNTSTTNSKNERNNNRNGLPFIYHGLSLGELKDLAGEEWTDIEMDPESLKALAYTVATRRLREQGIVPDDYTSITMCKQCGSVPMWKGFPKESHCCVWCFNRISGRPVPHVENVQESRQRGEFSETTDKQ